MTTRLVSLRFVPRGADGWGTPDLRFGEVLTMIVGPNGCGKTPLVKGLAFALGHSVELPSEIVKHCSSVVLGIDTDGERGWIERSVSSEFDIKISCPAGRLPSSFRDEKLFARWMITRLGIPHRVLKAQSGGGEVPPYMAVLVPAFCVDQDTGWSGLYCPPTNRRFIKDQREEVVRWLLDLAARNLPTNQSEYDEATRVLASAEQLVEIKRKTMAALRLELGGLSAHEAKEALLAEKAALVSRIEDHGKVLETLATTTSSIDTQIRQYAAQRDSASYRLEAARRRRADLQRLAGELEAEVEILESNELAAEAFRTLCPHPDCQFFREPHQSYGRRLLYLKDQAKDFAVGQKQLDAEVAELEQEVASRQAALSEATAAKDRSVAATPSRQLVQAVERAAKLLGSVEHKLSLLERFEHAKGELEKLLADVDQAQMRAEELRPKRSERADVSRMNGARSQLASAYLEWQDVLRTPNVPREAFFDDRFRLHLGGDTFSENSGYSGSTRTRIVLAFHAALLESSVALGGNHPGFLVLDAPRQHELHAEDLSAFIAKFAEKAGKASPPVQLILAATEENLVADETSCETWRPGYTTPDGNRFFGSE